MISSALGAGPEPDGSRHGLGFGCDDNPEQWPADVRPEDARLMREAGVTLATATASDPPWPAHRHPEVLPVDVDGRRLHAGSRQTWCPSSPVFRERSLDLVGRLAEGYHGPLPGRPVVTRVERGAGRAWYVACVREENP